MTDMQLRLWSKTLQGAKEEKTNNWIAVQLPLSRDTTSYVPRLLSLQCRLVFGRDAVLWRNMSLLRFPEQKYMENHDNDNDIYLLRISI